SARGTRRGATRRAAGTWPGRPLTSVVRGRREPAERCRRVGVAGRDDGGVERGPAARAAVLTDRYRARRSTIAVMTSSSSPGPRTAGRELVENEIYEQAFRLFADRGFAGTSLQDIADALGITRPALYYYVKSKDELLAKLAADVAGGSAAQITEVATRP